MKIADRLPADPRLSWNRRGGVVLTALLGRVGHEVTFARLVELTGLTVEDVRKQIRRLTTMTVLSRRTDLNECPAKDYFELPSTSVVRARTLLQLADDATLRELVEERGLDIDIAYGRFLERQPYPVALGKALREARTDLGWSLVDAEAVAPVSTATLSNYERGVTVPTLIMLAELALRYGVDAVDLIRYAACHSKPDKRVQRLKVADPTLRATLTHQFVTHDQHEVARQAIRRTQRAGGRPASSLHPRSAARLQSNVCATSLIGSRVMDRQLLEPSQMDGVLTYRFDSTGHQVALLPARCKLGRHTLGHSQFRAVVRDGEATISCLACATDGADHFWRLTATTTPDRAELSEEFYFDLALRRAQRAILPVNSHDA